MAMRDPLLVFATAFNAKKSKYPECECGFKPPHHVAHFIDETKDQT
jgi:hypothetical protein